MKNIFRPISKVKKYAIILVALGVFLIPNFFVTVGNFVGAKVAYAQTAENKINGQAQTLTSETTGKHPGAAYKGGIYAAVLADLEDVGMAQQVADSAYEELYPKARDRFLKQNQVSLGTGSQSDYEASIKKYEDALFVINTDRGILKTQEDVDAARKAIDDQEALKAKIAEDAKRVEESDKQVRIQSAIDNATDQTPAGRAAAAKAEKDHQEYRATGSKPKPPGAILCGFSGSVGVVSIGNGGTIEGCIAIVAYGFLKICALFLSLVGLLFNLTLNFTLNIGNVINVPGDSPGPVGLAGSAGAIYVGWSTIRDFVNVAFIFVLLFASISIILKGDKYGWQKVVKNLVIAALLINFSLFFTKAIIDLSNIMALQFYARILDASNQAGGNQTSMSGGLSEGLMNTLGLSTIWTPGKGLTSSDVNSLASNNNNSGGIDAYGVIAISIFGGIFLLVFGSVLLLAIVQFLMRSVVLIFLMITSPIGFVGGAIPGLEKVSSDWWSRLKNNAIFAPAYMAVLFIAAQMIFGPARNSIAGGGNIAQLITSDGKESFIGIGVWFAFVIGLLLAAQLSARSFADKFGSSFTGKVEGWLKNRAIGGANMAVAPVRIGLGNAARTASENRFVKKLATAPIIKQLGGQSLYNSIKNLQDVKVGTKSYKDTVDERIKRDQTTYERLGESTIRRGAFESDDSFKKREALNKNASTRARANFLGMDQDKFNTKNTNIKLSKLNPFNWFRPTNSNGELQEQSFSEANFAAYKKSTSSTFGPGRRKAMKEVGKKTNPLSKAGGAEDIATKIEALDKELKASQVAYEADTKIYDDQVKAIEGAGRVNITGPNIPPQIIKSWAGAKRSLAAHIQARATEERNLQALQRQLKQIENQDKDKK